MGRRSSGLHGALVAGLVLIPSNAFGRAADLGSRGLGAPSASIARAPAAPRAGIWRIASGGRGDDDFAGGFTISSDRAVWRLRGTIEPQAPAACGNGVVTVGGALRIFDAIGMTPQGSRYSEWVVGRNVPSADPVIQPERVQLTVAGRVTPGSLDIVFSAARDASGGDIYYDAGNCDLNFLVRRR
jgi:hypothetical protein